MSVRRAITLTALLALAVALAAPARPDALVVTKAMTATTIAEVFVDDARIRLELEIGVLDLSLIHI